MTKVLLVEDDPAISRLYQKALTFENFEVQTADNGLTALDMVPSFQPNIILLDIMMPTMNGIQFLEQLRLTGAFSTIPVIVLTNVSDSDVTLAAVNAGAALILIKSATEPDDVIKAVKGVLSRDILQTESLDGEESEQL
jgi:DNA-binding response OmpR family regulator